MFHKHVWVEGSREFYDSKHVRFAGETQLYSGPTTIVNIRCTSCLKYKQQQIKEHVPKAPEQDSSLKSLDSLWDHKTQ